MSAAAMLKGLQSASVNSFSFTSCVAPGFVLLFCKIFHMPWKAMNCLTAFFSVMVGLCPDWHHFCEDSLSSLYFRLFKALMVKHEIPDQGILPMEKSFVPLISSKGCPKRKTCHISSSHFPLWRQEKKHHQCTTSQWIAMKISKKGSTTWTSNTNKGHQKSKICYLTGFSVPP